MLQINSFHWGDLEDALSQRIVYPLMNCYYAANGTTFQKNVSQLTVVIEICDKLYKDDSNLNDVESDVLQISRDIFNTINKSNRWKKLGSVQSSIGTKFKHSTQDVIACVSNQISFRFRDVSGICDLPMDNYDFDQDTPTGICPSVTIFNTDLSFSQSINAGDAYELPDITITAKNSLNATISTEIVPSVQDKDIIISDSNVINSDGSYNQSVLAEGTLNLPDVLISATNSDGDVLASQGVPSAKDYELSISDVDVNVNTTTEGQVPVGDIDITIEDTSGTSVTPDSITLTGNSLVIVLPVLSLNTFTGKTGQTTPASPNANYSDGDTQRGRGVDFFTLSDNNPFGNNLRFTGTTGTGIIQADGIMIDWLYRSETSVHTWFTTPQVAVTFNDDIATAYASTFGGLSNWFLPNKREQDTIMNHEISIATNYPPLNATPLILRTCTEDPNDTTKNLTHVPGTHTETSESKAFGTPRRWMPFRITLLSELGL